MKPHEEYVGGETRMIPNKRRYAVIGWLVWTLGKRRVRRRLHLARR